MSFSFSKNFVGGTYSSSRMKGSLGLGSWVCFHPLNYRENKKKNTNASNRRRGLQGRIAILWTASMYLEKSQEFTYTIEKMVVLTTFHLNISMLTSNKNFRAFLQKTQNMLSKLYKVCFAIDDTQQVMTLQQPLVFSIPTDSYFPKSSLVEHWYCSLYNTELFRQSGLKSA